MYPFCFSCTLGSLIRDLVEHPLEHPLQVGFFLGEFVYCRSSIARVICELALQTLEVFLHFSLFSIEFCSFCVGALRGLISELCLPRGVLRLLFDRQAAALELCDTLHVQTLFVSLRENARWDRSGGRNA